MVYTARHPSCVQPLMAVYKHHMVERTGIKPVPVKTL
nr:MAG TPA: hypothetical protein [Caudoviricetes sp.]